MTDDNLKIHPKFQTIKINQEWTDPENNGRWAKIVAVYLEDTLHKEGILRRKNREIGEIFYLLVCSDAFKSNPDLNWKDEDIDKALVQKDYSQKQVIEYVSEIIDSIGAVSVDDFDKAMRKVFDMSDWDQSSEVLTEGTKS